MEKSRVKSCVSIRTLVLVKRVNLVPSNGQVKGDEGEGRRELSDEVLSIG